MSGLPVFPNQETRFCEVCMRNIPASKVYFWKDNPEYKKTENAKPYLYKCKETCVTAKILREIYSDRDVKVLNIPYKGYGNKLNFIYTINGMASSRDMQAATPRTLKILLEKGNNVEGWDFSLSENYKIPPPTMVDKNFSYSKETLSKFSLENVTEDYVEFEGTKFYGCSFFYRGLHYEEMMPESNIEFLKHQAKNSQL